MFPYTHHVLGYLCLYLYCSLWLNKRSEIAYFLPKLAFNMDIIMVKSHGSHVATFPPAPLLKSYSTIKLVLSPHKYSLWSNSLHWGLSSLFSNFITFFGLVFSPPLSLPDKFTLPLVKFISSSWSWSQTLPKPYLKRCIDFPSLS